MTDKPALEYHPRGAVVHRGDTITHVYGWPEDGGHVWEVADTRGGPVRREVRYLGKSSLTILTEDTPLKTAMHIARIHGIPADDVRER